MQKIILLILITVFMGCAHTVEEELHPNEDHSLVRFLFYYGEEIVFELSETYGDRLDDSTELDEGEIPWDWVKEKEGDVFLIYRTDIGAFDYAQLESLQPYPTGDGGVHGIIGNVRTVLHNENLRPGMFVGVMYPTSNTKPIKPSDLQLVNIGHKLILEEIKSSFNIHQSAKVLAYYKDEDTKRSLIFVKEVHETDLVVKEIYRNDFNTNLEVLRIFFNSEGLIHELDFPEGLFKLEKGLKTHDPFGEKDYTPYKGKLVVIPDLDENEFPEFIVDGGNVTYFFTFKCLDKKTPCINLERLLYLGP